MFLIHISSAASIVVTCQLSLSFCFLLVVIFCWLAVGWLACLLLCKPSMVPDLKENSFHIKRKVHSQSACWLAGCLHAFLACLVAGWLAGRLAGWLTCLQSSREMILSKVFDDPKVYSVVFVLMLPPSSYHSSQRALPKFIRDVCAILYTILTYSSRHTRLT